MSFGLSGLISGASNISCSCSISSMMRSASIRSQYPTWAWQIVNRRGICCCVPARKSCTKQESALLVFGIHSFDIFDGKSHHGLVADLSRQYLVIHSSDVQVGFAAIDPCIGRGSAVAKGFFKAAYFRPPTQRLRGVGGRQNGDSAFDDRFHW